MMFFARVDIVKEIDNMCLFVHGNVYENQNVYSIILTESIVRHFTLWVQYSGKIINSTLYYIDIYILLELIL